MQVYLVGGAVRDKLLHLPVRERDWVVVGATPQEMLDRGYIQVGKDFPVFLHPETKDEYALARTERKTGPGYKGFEFHASPDVTLEQDLMRRDLTINAMAETTDGVLIDPCRGREDLRDGLLRHISPAFAEDPVRVLRVARFAAQFSKWGFRVAHDTNRLMRKMVEKGEVDHLVAERVWAELAKALASDAPEKFFTVLRGCGALSVLFPEIDREHPEQRQAHGSDQGIAALDALRDSASCSDDPHIRFAVLLLALGHDLPREQRLTQAEALCERLRTPNDYTRLGLAAIRLQPLAVSNRPEDMLTLMESAGAFKQTKRWKQLLAVYQASKVIELDRADKLALTGERAARVNAAQLADRKLSGPALGEAIHAQRLRMIEKQFSDGR